jgi:RecA/RadA recombinase
MRCRAVPAEARTALDPEALRALVAEIARFYVSDKALRRAQRRMADLLSRGGDLPEKAVRAYLAEVRRYFEAFEREAHAHLGDVDRRLARASQLQYNLTAERGVTARRVEATQGVLARVGDLGDFG